MTRKRKVTAFKEGEVGSYIVAVFGWKGGGYGAMIRKIWHESVFTILYTPDHSKPQVCSTIDAAWAYGQTIALIRSV